MKANLKIENKKNLKDLIIGIQKDTKKVVTGYKGENGRIFEINEDMLSLSAEGFVRDNFIIKSKVELIVDSLECSFGHIDSLITMIGGIVQHFERNETKDANQKLATFTEVTELFIQLMIHVNKNIKQIYPEYKKTEDVIQIEMHLISTFKSLLGACQKGDTIMLCDLLEYELKDNFYKWKKTVLPKLIRLINNSKK